jgi:hypothetical protein
MARNITEADIHQLGYRLVGNEAVPQRDARPDPSWDLPALVVYAKGELANAQHAETESILQAHKSAVHLFWAGCALWFARDKCKIQGRGRWTAFKAQHGLADTTANDAIRLYEHAKTEEALIGLGITEAKKRYVYPEPDEDEETHGEQPQTHARQAHNESKGQVTKTNRTTSSMPRGTLADELEDIAQRLHEIAQNEMGKVDWSVEDFGSVHKAALALEKTVARILKRISDETPAA